MLKYCASNGPSLDTPAQNCFQGSCCCTLLVCRKVLTLYITDLCCVCNQDSDMLLLNFGVTWIFVSFNWIYFLDVSQASWRHLCAKHWLMALTLTTLLFIFMGSHNSNLLLALPVVSVLKQSKVRTAHLFFLVVQICCICIYRSARGSACKAGLF